MVLKKPCGFLDVFRKSFFLLEEAVLTITRTSLPTSRKRGLPGVTTITPLGLVLALLILVWTSPVSAQVDFCWDPEMPAISETVTFTIDDDGIIPLSWDFGGPNCDGDAGVVDCTWIPEYCRHISWSYAEAGAKAVHLVTEQGEVTHTVEVQNSGSCCTKDGKPSAAFSMSPNPAYTGQTVVFTDLSAKSAPHKDAEVAFEFEPQNPEIGELVVFYITGVDSIDSAEWNFGGEGCGDLTPEQVCEPIFTDCLTSSYIYAGAGDKTVRLTINGGLHESTQTVTVQNEGHCDGGTCTYHVDPTSRTFSHTGGTSGISISSGPDCQWIATSTAGWIEIIAGENGSGNGSVTYAVESNVGDARTGRITVEGRIHTVHQEAFGGGAPGDTAPDSWTWTILRDDETVATSDQQHFTHSFDVPGLYFVRLEAANCAGSDVETGFLVVEEPPTSAEGWVVPSAVHAPGLNNTKWRTDLWIFNPRDSVLDLDVEFLPEDTDNWLVDHPTLSLQIPPQGTAALEDVLELIPGVIVDDQAVIGSLLIQSPGDDEAAPYMVSRTYNETPDGTYGQFVPSSPVPPMAADRLFLTGLTQDSQARTNIRLANLGTETTEVTLFVLSDDGHFLGQPVVVSIPPMSTIQVNGIAEAAWAGADLELFSVRVDTDVDTVLAWASVVDNRTGDPVLYNPLALESASRTLWVPGVAHVSGAHDSRWRSDITFFNTNVRPLDTEVTYIPSESLETGPPLEIDNLQPGIALFYGDVLAEEFLSEDETSSGYFIIDGPGQEPPLQPAARTYNLDPSGGAFGQNLHIFEGTDLLTPGQRAFIPGVTLSAGETEGFRTNLGLLNIDGTGWTEVSLTLFDDQGLVAGETPSLWLAPGQLTQFNLASRLGLAGIDVVGAVMIEHLSGGSVVAYASVIDNKTQDPILIPATPEAP